MGISGVWDGRQVAADYGWQKFFDALCHAITSTGSLQQRLGSLVLAVSDLRRKNFPDDDTWMRFEQFLTATTGHPATEAKADIKTTTLQMKDEEARKWLHEAVRIFSNLSEEAEV